LEEDSWDGEDDDNDLYDELNEIINKETLDD